LWAALLVAFPACIARTAWVVNPDVIGPHGEHLMQLECGTSGYCMVFARKTCAGDFDIVTFTPASGEMLVQCKNPSPIPADAGVYW
jgi:hypothetical protein